MTTRFSHTLDGVVAADWIDANGHMNIKRYLALFEDASWTLWDRLTGHQDGDLSMVAGRIFIEHRLELHTDRPVEVLSACQSWDSRSLLFMHRLKARDGKREIAATAEFLASAFSLSKRQSVVLPTELQDSIRDRAIVGIKPKLARMLHPVKAETPQSVRPAENWNIVVFVIENKGNHAGLFIPGHGLADLSLAGARIVQLDDKRFPKGIPESFPIEVHEPQEALAFLDRAGMLCREIVEQERNQSGWHLTEDAPDYVLKLRDTRSSDPKNMNCVEWIAHALDLGGAHIPKDVLTPEQLRQWARNRTQLQVTYHG